MNVSVEQILGVDQVWCINLDRRRDRWEYLLHHLNHRGITFSTLKRFSAVDGKNITTEDINKLVHPSFSECIFQKKRTYHEQLSIGAVGCYLSHIKLWEVAAKENKTLLILEDDVKFAIDFTTRIKSLVQEIPKDFDAVFFHSCLKKSPLEKVSPHILRPHIFYTTDCYMISPIGAKKMLQYALPMRYQLDSYISVLTPVFDIYVIKPDLTQQSLLGTDAQTTSSADKYLFIQGSDKNWLVLSCLLFIFLLLIVLWLVFALKPGC